MLGKEVYILYRLVAEELVANKEKLPLPPVAPKLDMEMMRKLMRKNTFDETLYKKEYLPLKWTKLKDSDSKDCKSKQSIFILLKLLFKLNLNLDDIYTLEAERAKKITENIDWQGLDCFKL